MPQTLSAITVISSAASSSSSSRWSPSSFPLSATTLLSSTMDSSDHARPSAFIVSDKLLAGGFAGATARTIVAPFDRLKMLMQTQRPAAGAAAASSNRISSSASAIATPSRSASTLTLTLPTTSTSTAASSSSLKYTSTLQGLRTIVHEEGMLALWKGNMLNVMRVFPYSAIQFGTYDVFKQALLAASTSASSSSSATSTSTSLTPIARLACGAMAGVCATTITHPMDVLRLRVSVQRDVHTFGDATRQLLREGGVRALFKGYVPTLLSVCPFIAVNFACFDWLSSQAFVQARASSPACTMLMGATSAMIAQSVCYPLDTVRRQMQMPGAAATSTLQAMRAILQQQGVRALYAGIVPNAVKVVPANAMRFFIFDLIQKQLRGSSTDAMACL